MCVFFFWLLVLALELYFLYKCSKICLKIACGVYKIITNIFWESKFSLMFLVANNTYFRNKSASRKKKQFSVLWFPMRNITFTKMTCFSIIQLSHKNMKVKNNKSVTRTAKTFCVLIKIRLHRCCSFKKRIFYGRQLRYILFL